jgi:hypothetical protein
MADAADPPLQPADQALREEPVEHADTGAGRGRLVGVVAEEAAPEVTGGREPVLVKHPQDGPIPLAQSGREPLEFTLTDPRGGHRLLLVLPCWVLKMSWEMPQTVVCRI